MKPRQVSLPADQLLAHSPLFYSTCILSLIWLCKQKPSVWFCWKWSDSFAYLDDMWCSPPAVYVGGVWPLTAQASSFFVVVLSHCNETPPNDSACLENDWLREKTLLSRKICHRWWLLKGQDGTKSVSGLYEQLSRQREGGWTRGFHMAEAGVTVAWRVIKKREGGRESATPSTDPHAPPTPPAPVSGPRHRQWVWVVWTQLVDRPWALTNKQFFGLWPDGGTIHYVISWLDYPASVTGFSCFEPV